MFFFCCFLKFTEPQQAFIVLAVSGILSLCETPEGLYGLENVTRDPINIVVGRKRAKLKCWSELSLQNYFFLLLPGSAVVKNCAFVCFVRVHACCVVARQYSAVLRMLQIRQSSSTVNFAASETSFSFSRLLMVRPPLLLLDLERNGQM